MSTTRWTGWPWAIVAGLALGGTGSALAQAQDAAQQQKLLPPRWDKSAALGLTLTRGNSKTLLFTGNLLATRKEARNEYNFGMDATYGENNDVKSAESFHGFAQYNRLLTLRLFGYLRVEGLHDGVAAVKYRFILGPGGGYYFIKGTNATLRGEVGPGYVIEKQADKEKNYLTLRVAERYDHKLNDRVKLWQMAEVLPQVDNFENYIINAEVGLETTLAKQLSLRTYLQDIFHSLPAKNREKNDLKLVTAIAYKF